MSEPRTIHRCWLADGAVVGQIFDARTEQRPDMPNGPDGQAYRDWIVGVDIEGHDAAWPAEMAERLAGGRA